MIKIIDNGELITFKNNGLSNFKILKIISLSSFFVGLLVIFIFYNFSAMLKFKYLDIKKNYTNDDKYLASITENGLWIKDEIDNKINFINAKKIDLNNLLDVEIIQLDKNFNHLQTIKAKKSNIKNNIWEIDNATIYKDNNSVQENKNIKFNSHFNFEKINNLYSNLSSITMWGLFELKKDYDLVNYSTVEIEYHLQKIMSYLFSYDYVNIINGFDDEYKIPKKQNHLCNFRNFNLSFNLLYKLFFGIIGKNERLPLLIALWLPLIILVMISIIGSIKINEK